MAAYDWWDVMFAILLLAGGEGQVILVCSPGRLPQIIRIGKFHAWLLMIGWMLCAIMFSAGVGGADSIIIANH